METTSTAGTHLKGDFLFQMNQYIYKLTGELKWKVREGRRGKK